MNQKLREFFSNYDNAIIAWFIMVGLTALGLYSKIDQRILGAIILLIGISGQACIALIAWIGFIPFIGSFIAKILALPFIWLLNGIGYLVSAIASSEGTQKM